MSLQFPAGIAPGEGAEFNTLTIARDGNGDPVLRGTALAGALRNAWTQHLVQSDGNADAAEAAAREIFGFASDDESGGNAESRVRVGDAVIQTGSQPTVTRTYHLRNRHTGAVVDGGLFSLEACPRGSSTIVAIWLHDDDESPGRSTEFLQTLVGLLQSGITLGGKSARGIGIVQLDPAETVYRIYDLTNAEDHAQYLDDFRQWKSPQKNRPGGDVLLADSAASANHLSVNLTLQIPRGQDLLVGDGQGLEHEMEPQRVVGADGKEYWRLPGASLRGLFRGWIARLAARDGRPVADSLARHQAELRGNNGETRLTGENLGWCFLPRSDRQHGTATTDCPVSDLFGSLIKPGRIHISDAYAVRSPHGGEEQARMHVAVDRITGGAAESMLFENTVLTAHSGATSPQFDVTIRITEPQSCEADWLAKTLLALHVGVVRVGSSKSSGRLEISKLEATGQCADAFDQLHSFMNSAAN